LQDTVDYVAVYETIKEVVEGKAFSLIERLAATLAEKILEKFPVFRVTLRVRKKIPPIAGTIDHIEIEVTRRQPDASKIISDSKE
jgi:dihydroneopterin aldolase